MKKRLLAGMYSVLIIAALVAVGWLTVPADWAGLNAPSSTVFTWQFLFFTPGKSTAAHIHRFVGDYHTLMNGDPCQQVYYTLDGKTVIVYYSFDSDQPMRLLYTELYTALPTYTPVEDPALLTDHPARAFRALARGQITKTEVEAVFGPPSAAPMPDAGRIWREYYTKEGWIAVLIYDTNEILQDIYIQRNDRTVEVYPRIDTAAHPDYE